MIADAEPWEGSLCSRTNKVVESVSYCVMIESGGWTGSWAREPKDA